MIIARCDSLFISDVHKQHRIVSFRRRSASQNYSSLCMLRDTDWSPVTSEHCARLAFDQFYIIIHNILDIAYPMRSVTITSRDPPFLTPNIKYLLCQRNNLIHAGHHERAAAVFSKIWAAIKAFNAGRLSRINFTGGEGSVGSDMAIMWKLVNEVTGASSCHNLQAPTDLSADAINLHYASVSTDPAYTAPLMKSTCSPSQDQL